MIHARDSVLVVWSEEEAYYLHCLSLSHKQLPEVTFSIAESGACVQKLLRNMTAIIGGASTIRDSKQMRGRYGTEHGQQFKSGMAMKGCPFVVAKGAPRTFTYYALKRNREPDEFMEECARHAVAMKTLERIPAGSSPNTSAASIRTWVGWALGLGSRAPLDMRASGI